MQGPPVRAKRQRIANRIYKDAFDHERHRAWHYHRAQAHFRGEAHQISPEQWFEIWPQELWVRRGYGGDDLILTRRDDKEAWHIDNVEIITRRERKLRNNRRNKSNVGR